MTLLKPVAETSGQDQMNDYNRSSSLIRRASYSPPAGTVWGILGCVLADVVVEGDEVTLVGNIEALAGVTSVHDPRAWMPAPSELLINSGADTHELRLHVVAAESGNESLGGFSYVLRRNNNILLTSYLGKNLFVFAARLPAALDATGITALQTALQGIAGINLARYLVGGNVPSTASGVTLGLEVRFRIDSVPG